MAPKKARRFVPRQRRKYPGRKRGLVVTAHEARSFGTGVGFPRFLLFFVDPFHFAHYYICLCYSIIGLAFWEAQHLSGWEALSHLCNIRTCFVHDIERVSIGELAWSKRWARRSSRR